MDCIELVEVITDYLEGELPAAERERFEGHLRECPYCEIYLQQMRATLAAIGRVPSETLSDPARDTLLQAFRSWKK